jgi:hypothetical protein
MRRILLSAVLLILGAYASWPLVPSAAAADEPAAAPAAAPAVGAQPAGTPAAPVAAVHEFKPPPGYKTRKRGDETVYCRSRAVLGTRLKSEECHTQAELDAIDKAMRASQEDMQQRARMCGTGSMCTGG